MLNLISDMEPMMDKKNQKPKDELIDEEDLLNFELDDLSLEDMEKKASEFENDIIELVDLVEKGREDDEGEEKQETVRAKEEPLDEDQEEFGFATDEITSIGDLLDEESLDNSASDLDLSGLSLSDLNPVSEPEPAEKKGEGEISEAELEEMLEEAPTEMLDLELQEMEVPDEEVELDLEEEEAPQDELKAGTIEEPETDDKEILESDVEDRRKDTGFEDITLDFDEAEALEEDQISEGDFADMLQEVDVDRVALDFEEEPAEPMELDLDQDKAPTEVFDIKTALEIEIEEKAEDDYDDESEEELLTPIGEKHPRKEPVDLSAPEEVFQEPEALPLQPASEKSLGLSEEVIEDIVSRVVKDVVERVTRETMIEVAEKVITEAIDALKQSLESISD
jgi:hypothetical protein